jgi:hypothetical protein
MAWEWVAPVATALSGMVGVGFTWYAGHQGRKHAERVADKSASHSLAQAREARRADAYIEILTLTNGMTAAVGEITAIYKDREDPPLPELDKQVAVSALVGLYGSQEVRAIYRDWFQQVSKLLDNYREIQANAKRGGADRDPGLWKQQGALGKAMRDAADRLRDQMNRELST